MEIDIGEVTKNFDIGEVTKNLESLEIFEESLNSNESETEGASRKKRGRSNAVIIKKKVEKKQPKDLLSKLIQPIKELKEKKDKEKQYNRLVSLCQEVKLDDILRGHEITALFIEVCEAERSFENFNALIWYNRHQNYS